MSLIATSLGYEKNEETGEVEMIIRLLVQTEADMPKLTAADIWDATPLRLIRADEAAGGGE